MTALFDYLLGAGERRWRHVEAKRARAFSGKVVTGFPSENATTQNELEWFPVQLNRKQLQRS
jgi:hypothetical protein